MKHEDLSFDETKVLAVARFLLSIQHRFPPAAKLAEALEEPGDDDRIAAALDEIRAELPPGGLRALAETEDEHRLLSEVFGQ